MRKRILTGCLILIVFANSFAPAFSQTFKPENNPKIVIFYEKNHRAYTSALRLEALLRHFTKSVKNLTLDFSSPQLINKADKIFFISSSDNERVFNLVENSDPNKRVVWINSGAAKKKVVLKKYGITILEAQKANYIRYKKIKLVNSYGSVNPIHIQNKSPARAIAWAQQNNKKYPFILQSKNLSIISGNALYDASEKSSVLALADYLHDIIEKHPSRKKAIVRIEDVDPTVNTANLKLMIDYLYINEVPFAIAVIPVYKANAKAKPIYAHQRPEFVETLKYAQKRGASFVLHGYTHQLKGKTAVDSEFWQLKKGEPIHNSRLTESKIKSALTEMKRIGIKPAMWETPNYAAGNAERKIFAQYFKVAFERQLSYVPYIFQNKYGQTVIPETLNYPQPAFVKGARPKNVIDNAKRLGVVRDGYAAFFVHAFMPVNDLAEIVSGLKSQGYIFVNPSTIVGKDIIKPEPPFILDKLLFYFAFLVNKALHEVNWWIFVSAAFITYYLVIFGLSFIGRRRGKNMKTKRKPYFIFIVPALNEEKVIEKTIKSLMKIKARNFKILAINDNSDDDTLRVLESIRSRRLQILSTKPPNARNGKGNALNLAYHYLNNIEIVKKYSRDNVVVAIVDSDGIVDDQIIKKIEPFFQDPKTAAVQTPVRILNCDDNLWTKWQDFEFRVFSFMFQSARELLGSVGLGGNGQFVRLSALDSLGKAPWSDCLTEDLDIGIRLLLLGWRNRYCSTTFVAQQAVPKFRPLVKQRTRWFQGHLSCWKHLPNLTISKLPILTKVDVSYYLLAIIFAFLVIPANFAALILAAYVVLNTGLLKLIIGVYGIKTFWTLYIFYFGALPIFIYSYWRTKKQSIFSAFVLTHIYLFVSVIWLFAAYFALFRMGRSKTRWVKTPRYEVN